MTDFSWFVVIDGKQQGPMSSTAIQNLYNNGRIGADTLVWCEGMNEWLPLNSVKLFTPIMPSNQNNENMGENRVSIAEITAAESNFYNHYKRVYFALYTAGVIIFLCFYPTSLFTIPSSIKPFLFIFPIMSLVIIVFLGNRNKAYEIIRTKNFYILQSKQTQKKTGEKPNRLKQILTTVGIFLLIFIMNFAIFKFVFAISYTFVIVIFVLLYFSVFFVCCFMIYKHYIGIRNLHAENMFHSVIFDIVFMVIFIVLLPIMIYPTIAEKNFKFTYKSSMILSGVKRTTDKNVSTHVAKEDIEKIIETHKCDNCGKSWYVKEYNLKKKQTSGYDAAITTQYITPDSAEAQRLHEKVLNTLEEDFQKNEIEVSDTNVAQEPVTSEFIPRKSKMPGGLPTFYSLIMLIWVLISKSSDAEMLMRVKNHRNIVS